MVWTKSLHNLKVHIKIFKLKGQNFWNLPELGSFKSHVPFLDKLKAWHFALKFSWSDSQDSPAITMLAPEIKILTQALLLGARTIYSVGSDTECWKFEMQKNSEIALK